MADPDDLVARCQRGDASAFRELFALHRSDVARLVYRMLGSVADLDDVVQEVFFQVHRSIKDFRGTAKLSTWIHRVAVNVVLMHRRAARSRPRLVEEIADDLEADTSLPPDEDASRRRRARAFERLLDRLAEKKRTVFVLHELEGIAPGEIAKIVGAPVLTVRTRLFYARRELGRMLRDEPELALFADSLGQDEERESSRDSVDPGPTDATRPIAEGAR